MESYLESVKKQFAYYKLLGEKTFEQVLEENCFGNSMRKAIALQ